MAYPLTRAECAALIDIVEESTSSNERTDTERSALLKLHQILEAHDIVIKRATRKSRSQDDMVADDMNTHMADRSEGDK